MPGPDRGEHSRDLEADRQRQASGSAPRAPLKSLKSTGLTPAARTSIVTSPGPGAGTSTSRTSSTSGPPYAGATTARAIVVIPET